MHVTAPHEPTKEGEKVAAEAPAPAAPPAPEVREIKIGKKVALIGTAPSSKMLAPYNDPDWQIWGCSPGNMNVLPKVDLWFEMHSNLLWPEYESYGKPYLEWLKQQKFPVFMQAFWPTLTGNYQPVQQIVPNAVAFPKDELVEEFGDEFFTSSFAWMMALAIKVGVQEIALYGIDMASRDEYIRQRPGFYYFKRKAMERGIKVSAPHESDIMQSPPLYAYSDSTPIGRKILARRTEINGRIGGMEQQHSQLGQNIQYLKGAQEDLDYFETIWSGVTNDMGKLQYELAKAKARIAELEAAKIGSPVMTFANPNMLKPGNWTVTAGPVTDPQKPKRRRKKMASPEQPITGETHG